MARPPLTEKEVRALMHGLTKAGSRIEAEQVGRLWDELQGMRDREAITMQLHDIEDWS
jgi:hypothetical protein